MSSRYRLVPCQVKHFDRLLIEVRALGWSQSELKRRTGLCSKLLIKAFKTKQISLAAAGRIALAIAAGKVETKVETNPLYV